MFIFQVQDYYLAMKFNKGDQCIKALYRLFTACCMLHNSKNAGVGRGHPYPKVMIAFMLVLQHWRATKYCGYQMMKTNMGIYNEELGELTFSILARSVLGDHTKDDFEHMCSLFRLLRVYRDVKSDVVDDTSSSNCLNWRHKIKVDGDEVVTTQLFFKSIIRQMVNGTYMSYDGSKKAFTNQQAGVLTKVKPTSPAVYMSKVDLLQYARAQIEALRGDMKTNFLYPYKHIWPECVNVDDEPQPGQVIAEGRALNEEKKIDLVADDDDGQALLEDPTSEVEELGEGKNPEDESDDTDGSHTDPDDLELNPLDNRSWAAWGTINMENRMVGKRRRRGVNYDEQKHRGEKKHPDPSV